MKRIACLVAALLLPIPGALAETTTAIGNSALALAALVAERSPLLRPRDKVVMLNLLEERLGVRAEKIVVQADTVVCRVSNVDIAHHACTLSFGAHKVELKARRAHELFATLAEAGVPPDGAAGTIYESLSHLSCTIDPPAIREKAGAGAECKFDPGAP